MRFRAVFCHVCLFSVRCLVLLRFLLLASSSCCFGSCVSLLLVGGAFGRCSVVVLPVAVSFWGSVAGCGVVCSSGAVGSFRGVAALVVSCLLVAGACPGMLPIGDRGHTNQLAIAFYLPEKVIP